MEMPAYVVADCPFCGGIAMTVNTYGTLLNEGTINRRKKCVDCKKRWTTCEIRKEVLDKLRKKKK